MKAKESYSFYMSETGENRVTPEEPLYFCQSQIEGL